MATTIRSFTSAYDLTDLTPELQLIPSTWGLINELGIFSDEGISQNTVTVESSNGTLGLVLDQVRGARNTVNTDDTRTLRSFAVPHHPTDDSVTPQDIFGKRAYGSADQAETEAAVIARKLERIRRNHAITVETARAYAITNGAIWAPNGTVAGNFYTDFGVSQKSVDFVLGTSTTDLTAKAEEVIAHIQDNIQSGEVITGVTCLASPEFFAKLINHATIKDAYRYYSSTQEPLRNRLGSGLYRRFVHGGVEYIEYRGAYNGTRLIPVGEAYFIPNGTQDMFKSYYAPCAKFGFLGTTGETAYAFTYRDPKDEHILIQSEHNALHLINRPQAVVKAVTSN